MTSDCSICMSPIHPIGLTYTICSHSFHLNCLNAWLENQSRRNIKNTCPICRQCIDECYTNIIYWNGTNNIKLSRSKELEIRYYLDGTIKYSLFINSNNKVIDGYFYNKNKVKIHYSTIPNIDMFRTNDLYGQTILDSFINYLNG